MKDLINVINRAYLDLWSKEELKSKALELRLTLMTFENKWNKSLSTAFGLRKNELDRIVISEKFIFSAAFL